MEPGYKSSCLTWAVPLCSLSNLSRARRYDAGNSRPLLSACFSVLPGGYLLIPAEIAFNSPRRSVTPSGVGKPNMKSGVRPTCCWLCCSSPPWLVRSAGMRSLNRIWRIWPYLRAHLSAPNMVKWGISEKILQRVVQTHWF